MSKRNHSNVEADIATDEKQQCEKTDDQKQPLNNWKTSSKEKLLESDDDNPNSCYGINVSTAMNKKVVKITNENIDEYLLRCPCYHGFLLHEYQPMLLRSSGDFLLRLSVRYLKKDRKKITGSKDKEMKTTREISKTPSTVAENTRLSVIIGVNINPSEKVEPSGGKSVFVDCLDDSPVKADIIDVPLSIEANSEGKWVSYSIEKKKKFPSIEELTQFYKQNFATYREKKFNLVRGVPLHSWELDRQSIEIGAKRLGEGAFGEVKLGTLKPSESKSADGKEQQQTSVAIKMLKSEESKGCIKEMMHEARLQLCMKHKNVLRTIGVCILKSPLFIVTEYCEHGALREYLQKNKCETDEKLRFCLASARGVEYIHSKLLIHRDLATRNIMLTENNVPKIADFGLARYGATYKMTGNAKIPIRYLAPETLTSYKFSQRSDVYAFGLVIWEIFENGLEPYVKPQPHQETIAPKGTHMKGQQVKEIIKKELWVKLNAEAPPTLQTFLSEKIFVTDEKKRPLMPEVVTFLKTLRRSMNRETVTCEK